MLLLAARRVFNTRDLDGRLVLLMSSFVSSFDKTTVKAGFEGGSFSRIVVEGDAVTDPKAWDTCFECVMNDDAPSNGEW